MGKEKLKVKCMSLQHIKHAKIVLQKGKLFSGILHCEVRGLHRRGLIWFAVPIYRLLSLS